MPRGYTVATAALAIDTPVKWLDNVLSHHAVSGVAQQRQGISRKLSIEGLLIVALAAVLVRELGAPMPKAIEIAQELAKNEGRYQWPSGFRLSLDLPTFRALLLERLQNAVEIAPLPRRGRPPANKTGRLD
jgi:hypothetical protein